MCVSERETIDDLEGTWWIDLVDLVIRSTPISLFISLFLFLVILDFELDFGTLDLDIWRMILKKEISVGKPHYSFRHFERLLFSDWFSLNPKSSIKRTRAKTTTAKAAFDPNSIWCSGVSIEKTGPYNTQISDNRFSPPISTVYT